MQILISFGLGAPALRLRTSERETHRNPAGLPKLAGEWLTNLAPTRFCLGKVIHRLDYICQIHRPETQIGLFLIPFGPIASHADTHQL